MKVLATWVRQQFRDSYLQMFPRVKIDDVPGGLLDHTED